MKKPDIVRVIETLSGQVIPESEWEAFEAVWSVLRIHRDRLWCRSDEPKPVEFSKVGDPETCPEAG